MKAVIAFAYLIAGISAAVLPGTEMQPDATRNERLISDQIISAIEDISQDIKDAGLDPLHIKKEVFTYELPVPVIFNAVAVVEEVLSTGLSDIVVNSMSYSVLFSRLTFDIELPHIHLSARVANAEANLFGKTLKVEADGRVDVRRISVLGVVRVRVGIISGISISSVDIDFSIGSINTNLRLLVQGQNYSEEINNLISVEVPATLEEFSDEINELIEVILLDVINENL